MHTEEYIRSNLERLGDWYHEIELPHGIKTPIKWPGLRRFWDQTRLGMDQVPYENKRVIDLGACDGGFSFEAEERGASRVVYGDVGQEGTINRFLFAREVKQSKVIPYFNLKAQCAYERLDSYRKWTDRERFDIIQHFGLLYHLPDMMASIMECRKLARTGGHIIIETAMFTGNAGECVARYNWDAGVYPESSTWWAPNRKCLEGMLVECLFYPKWFSSVPQKDGIDRAVIVAEASGTDDACQSLIKDVGDRLGICD